MSVSDLLPLGAVIKLECWDVGYIELCNTITQNNTINIDNSICLCSAVNKTSC